MTKYKLKQIFNEILFDSFNGCINELDRDIFSKKISNRIVVSEGSLYDEEMEELMEWFYELFDNANRCINENI